MRERGASSALPPLYFLHVWWARRPLTVSRAAILASLLPAYPDGDPDVKPWPNKFLKQFPTFDAYKQWFLKLIGITGDPVAGQKLIRWANDNEVKLKVNPYGYPRAFSVNPSADQLRELYDLLEWAWGTRDITFCDPMSGGGAIPFEALRYGLTVHSNELNPVASVILRATLDYPARFGKSLTSDIKKYGELWAKKVRQRLEQFFPVRTEGESIFCYVWARTVPCPITGKPVPLSPNWWLRKGENPVATKVIAEPAMGSCRFEIVSGKSACAKLNPDKGTIKGGGAVSCWSNGEPISGKYIKEVAQKGGMGEQLVAVGVKRAGSIEFRSPSSADEVAITSAELTLAKHWKGWLDSSLFPTEDIDTISNYDRGHRLYGAYKWADFFSPRQKLAVGTMVEVYREVSAEIDRSLADRTRAAAIKTYLAFCIDKSVDYNCRFTRLHPGRDVIANKFDKHNYAFKWSYGEFDASRNLAPWAVSQISDAYAGIAALAAPAGSTLLGDTSTQPAVERLTFTKGPAQRLPVPAGTLRLIVVDPPYYQNVMYAECADFFYVWLKRTVGDIYPGWFESEWTDKDDEATANYARFAALGKMKKRQLANSDYENKMAAAFGAMNDALTPDGVLTVMFTHREVEAWDTLGTALIAAGFKVDTSWPVRTESQHSTHQAKKNSAASTILLTCRKRAKSSEPVWWDDLKAKVKAVAREKAQQFEKEGITGVDLYISTFGPALAIISEHWPVLTSESDAKGDPLPLKPGDALDLARQEVINRRKQGLLLGRSVEFDPMTDWYLMAWDAFKAQQFPADEARKLALALGRDLEKDVIKDKRLVAKKAANVILNLPKDRRKKGMVDPDAEEFPSLIDALHTVMLVYDEEGSKACEVLVDKRGLRNDARLKALVEATMRAIPTTRGKNKKFLRPEMETLESLRLLLWSELPAPKEEEPPKPPEKTIPGTVDEEAIEEEDAGEGDEDEDTDDE